MELFVAKGVLLGLVIKGKLLTGLSFFYGLYAISNALDFSLMCFETPNQQYCLKKHTYLNT